VAQACRSNDDSARLRGFFGSTFVGRAYRPAGDSASPRGCVKVCMYIYACICVYAVILSVIASHVYLSVCMYVCVYVYVCIHVCACVILYLLVTLLDRATVYVGWCDRGEKDNRTRDLRVLRRAVTTVLSFA